MPKIESEKNSAARYLLRFDDICPSMNWETWDAIEKSLEEFHVQPILSVIPDNRDPGLIHSSANPRFWERVRAWQKKGWTIGLHGYRHLYQNSRAGILGLNSHSEFAGMTEEKQQRKISGGLAIMKREGVSPDLWVAPGHSFDLNTLRALKNQGIGVISDGFDLRPFGAHGLTWIPQQLWRIRRLPFGLWTVCFHHSHWRDEDFRAFQDGLRNLDGRLTGVAKVLAKPVRPQGFSGRIFGKLFLAALLGKRRMASSGGTKSK